MYSNVMNSPHISTREDDILRRNWVSPGLVGKIGKKEKKEAD
jgi:hypothetical protein